MRSYRSHIGIFVRRGRSDDSWRETNRRQRSRSRRIADESSDRGSQLHQYRLIMDNSIVFFLCCIYIIAAIAMWKGKLLSRSFTRSYQDYIGATRPGWRELGFSVEGKVPEEPCNTRVNRDVISTRDTRRRIHRADCKDCDLDDRMGGTKYSNIIADYVIAIRIRSHRRELCVTYRWCDRWQRVLSTERRDEGDKESVRVSCDHAKNTK